MAPKDNGDMFIKFMAALITSAAIKMSLDLGEIKTTVAVAVERIEQQEMRIRSLEADTKAR